MDVLEAYLTAARLDELAAVLRARAVLTEILGQALAWHSPAGVAFHARADALYRELTSVCAALDTMAQAVRSRCV